MIKEFAEKHMKSDEVKLEQELNRQIWSRGKTNPPRKMRVKMVKDEDGVVTVSLYEDVPEAAVEEKKPEPAAPEAPSAPDGATTRRAPTSLEELWLTYKSTGDEHLREQLILHYSPLVKYVAGRVATGLPQNVEQADLVSYGIFGLIDAIEKYDPDRGYKFETYAIARIKGAILDELRSIDWVPRSVRAKARAIEKAYGKLEGELHRTPSDVELAKELEMSDDQLQATLNRMPEREKIVLTLYYYEGLTLAEIGQVLGVTESRVCQIHTKAVLQLRARLGPAREAS